MAWELSRPGGPLMRRERKELLPRPATRASAGDGCGEERCVANEILLGLLVDYGEILHVRAVGCDAGAWVGDFTGGLEMGLVSDGF